MHQKLIRSILAAASLIVSSGATAQVPSAPVPKGATLLLAGRTEDLSANWLKRGSEQPAGWKVIDGAAVTGGGDIITRQKFTDFQLHVEFKVPLMADKKGQQRGNSGVKLQGRYEIQILDSYGIADPGRGDCGAVYTIAAPLVNACKPPEEWQSFDIVFRAPRMETDGSVKEKARVTVWQNHILVQNNTEMPKPTGNQPLDREVGSPGPLLLQDHGSKVQFRNIWVLTLPPEGAKHY